MMVWCLLCGSGIAASRRLEFGRLPFPLLSIRAIPKLYLDPTKRPQRITLNMFESVSVSSIESYVSLDYIVSPWL